MRWYKWVEVGAALGIEPFKQEKPTVILASPQMAVEAQRELIRLKCIALCRLLDELYQQGFTGGEVLTVKELQAACPNLSPYTVRKAIQQTEEKGIILKIFPSYARSIEGKKTKINKGRPAKKGLQVPDLQRLYTALNVQPETWQTNLPAYSRKNKAQYCAEVMASKIRHKAGEYAIKQLTKPMGISAPTLRTYCKRANIEVTPRFDMKPIKTADDIHALPANNKELAEWRQEGKFKGAVWLETLDGKYKFAPTQEGAERAGRNGRAFRLVKRLANHYKAMSEATYTRPAEPVKTAPVKTYAKPVTAKPKAEPKSTQADKVQKADFEKILECYREKMGEPSGTIKDILREWQRETYGACIGMAIDDETDDGAIIRFFWDNPDPLREWEKRGHEVKLDEDARRPLPLEDGWNFPVEELFSGVSRIGYLFYLYKNGVGGELNSEAARFIWDEENTSQSWIISETLREMSERGRGEIRKPFAYMRKVVNNKRQEREKEYEEEEQDERQ